MEVLRAMEPNPRACLACKAAFSSQEKRRSFASFYSFGIFSLGCFRFMGVVSLVLEEILATLYFFTGNQTSNETSFFGRSLMQNSATELNRWVLYVHV
jgi:hypothetical protein